MARQPVHHGGGKHTLTHTHTPRGKQRNKKKIPEVELFLHLCFISYGPLHPPTCSLSSVIVSQTRWSEYRFIRTMSFHLASALSPALLAASYFLTVMTRVMTRVIGRWRIDFKINLPPPPSPSSPPSSLLIFLLMRCTVLP